MTDPKADVVATAFTTARRQCRGLKGAVTRTHNEFVKIATYAFDNPNAHAEDQMTEALDSFKTARRKCDRAVQGMLDEQAFQPLLTDQTTKDLQGYLDATADMSESANKAFFAAMRQLQPPTPAAPANPAPAAPAAGNPQRPKPVDSLKPSFKLRPDSYPSEVGMWKKTFLAFANASGFDQYTPAERHIFLFSCVTVPLATRIQEHDNYRDNLPIDGDDSLMSILADIFGVRFPLFNRRLEYFRLKQAPGQRCSDWYMKLHQRGDTAEIRSLTMEDIEIFRIFTGVTDQELRKRLFLIQDPTLAKLKAEIQRYEALTSAETALNNEKARARKSTAKPTPYRNQKSGKPQPKGKKRPELPDALKNVCPRCGSRNHSGRDCPVDSKKLYCKTCQINGHTDKVCFKKHLGTRKPKRSDDKSKQNKAKARAACDDADNTDDDPGDDSDALYDASDEESAVANSATAVCRRLITSKATPTLYLDFTPVEQPHISFRAKVVPDTGATQTIMAASFCRKHGISWQPTTTSLYSASGKPMRVLGTTTFKVLKHKVHALICKDLSDTILLSWHDMVALKIIPRNFPAAARQVNVTELTDELKDTFKDVLDDHLGPETSMTGPPMRIHLRTDKPITPARFLTARKIPLHLQEGADAVVNQLLEKGVIARVEEPTDWVSPGHFVPKPNSTAVRLVTDYTKLNEFVKRPIHPFPSSADILQGINPESKWFAKLDAVHGYFQIPLDEESSLLTTFLLPSGRYRYTRAPMGLNASGDEFCMRSDMAIQGLPGISKLVDDILVEGRTLGELKKRLHKLLTRCREHRIKLSLKKLEIGQKVEFAGHIISASGIQPDPKKTEAISNFPTPTDLTQLRSFLGLANQLGHFIPDLAQSTSEMRRLLKKDVEYQWLNEHEVEFQKVKALLTSDLLVKPFDPSLKTDLLTDASCLHGLGYALIQHEKDDKGIRLVTCGSCSITDAQKRYAPVELECLAIVWAITKCSFWLRGSPGFRVVTDHNPLLGVFQKPLGEIDNPRLQRLRTKVASYTFTIEWQAGKGHHIADALSRSPVWSANSEISEDFEALALQIHHGDAPLQEELSLFTSSAKDDVEYDSLKEVILRKIKPGNLQPNNPARAFKSVLPSLSLITLPSNDQLIVYAGNRLVVPVRARSEILTLLHKAHQGAVKTKQLARQLYYWPGMTAAIEQMIDDCTTCSRHRPSLPKEKSVPPEEPTQPMHLVGTDLCEALGNHYLVCADKFSGFVLAQKIPNQSTATVTRILSRWFNLLGWPSIIRSDGGPCFRSDFRTFCDRNRIKHELASAYNPESNGLAEAAVKNVKSLLKKCNDTGEDFDAALSAFRMVPRANGYSPAELFFGRRPKGVLPALQAQFPISPAPGSEQKHSDLIKIHRKSPKRLYGLFQVGDQVLLQDQQTKLWEPGFKISAIRPDQKSYEVINSSGKTFLRNRRLIRKDRPQRRNATSAN
jgi:hypothetical protein